MASDDLTTTDYGEDLSCLDDVEEEGRVIADPRTILTQALIRRWTTPRGMLLDDENYGTDVTEYLNDDVDNASLMRLRSDLRSEGEKDERVRAIIVTSAVFTQVAGTAFGSVAVSLTVDSYDGDTFPLTLSVTSLTVELLEAA